MHYYIRIAYPYKSINSLGGKGMGMAFPLEKALIPTIHRQPSNQSLVDQYRAMNPRV